jgi:hypothetical protein
MVRGGAANATVERSIAVKGIRLRIELSFN